MAVAVLLGAVLLLAFSRPASGVSLLFSGYKRWPADSTCYAQFQLINSTTNAILYPLLRDGALMTVSTLYRERRQTGWTSVQFEPLCNGQVCVMQDLKAGGRVDFIIPLNPVASSKQFAVMCAGIPEVKRSALSLWLMRRLVPVVRALKIEITPPEVLSIYDQRVWCDTLIAPPKSTQPLVTE